MSDKKSEENYDDIDELFDYQQKKANKSSKRKWREIENFKERRREQRELASYDCYSL